MTDTILETVGLTREFSGFVAVDAVDLSVETGNIHALIGPNGAGKTTCFNLLTSFLPPTRGKITFKGRDITGMKPAMVARLGLVRSFQISAVFPHLTALENVRLALQRARGASFDFWRSESVLKVFDDRAHQLLFDVGLSSFTETVVADLSYGLKRALEIATTLALEPEMMLLDEPTAGMAHGDVDRIVELIKRIRIGPHHPDGGAQSLGRRRPLRQDHRPDPRQGAGRGHLRDGVEEPRSDHRLPGDCRCLRSPMLEINGLNAWYGESHILHGVDFEVREGEVVTLLGRNGAGKTTTMKSIMGIVPRREGSVKFRGAEMINRMPNQIARAGIAICPEERGIFGSLSVTENLMLPPIVHPGGLSVDEIYTLFPNLRERAETAHGTKLSGGEQQMLAIGRILRTGSKMLLLDEPTEGLAPVIVQQIGRTIREIKSRGFTVLLVEQNFRFAATVADRHYVMEHGKVVDMIPNHLLESSMDKLHEYLGV